MSNHYLNYTRKISTQKDLLDYESAYEQTFIEKSLNENFEGKKNRETIIKENATVPYTVWKLLLVLMSISLLFFIILIKIKLLFDPIDRMMKNVNSLMDS